MAPQATPRTLNPARVAIVALSVLTIAIPHKSLSQARIVLDRPAFTGEWVVEQQSGERWMHGNQQPRSTPFLATRRWVMVDSSRADRAGRRLYLTLERHAYGRDSALIVVGANGQVTHLDAGLAPLPTSSAAYPGMAERYEDMQRRGPGDAGVSLAESRLWHLVPSAPRQAPRVGLSWQDTIARVASDGPFRQAMHGTRTSRIVGQRVVDGRRLWLVRDSATVTYEEQYPEHERTLDTTVLVSRRAAGTIRGVHLYDPALLLARSRDDTTSLSGDATLRYPDGRTFSTPAHFERTRHWTLLDASAYAARMTELRTARDRAAGGMVLAPDTRSDKRPSASDAKARDSLRTASDSDLARRYTALAEKPMRNEPLDTAGLRAMLPFMEDPGLAWSVDQSRDWPYENLAQALTTRPPAVGTADSPYRSVACTPAACRLLADQWHSARESRLRDVGLVALVATDPARWADTLLALDGPQHPLLHDAALLVRGVGATWPAASKAPMPPTGSDWHAWLEWMDSRDPRYVAIKRESSLPPRFKQDTLPQVRFEESHVTAIRFFEARAGRAIVAELRRGYDTALSDSARLVFGTMLEGIGALEATDQRLVAWFRSGNPAQVALARRLLSSGFEKSVRADPSVSATLLERLLAAIVDSAPLWPYGVAGAEAPRGEPATLHMPRSGFFIDSTGLPPGILARWGSRVRLASPSAWNERDTRAGGVLYSIAPIMTWGHFARVKVDVAERLVRKPGEMPQAYASGATYWLMNVDGQWVIVDESRWVT